MAEGHDEQEGCSLGHPERVRKLQAAHRARCRQGARHHRDPAQRHAAGDHEPARWHFRLDGADYLAENDGHQWSLTATAPQAPADVTITATTQSLATLIFAGSDLGIDITGKPRAVERFRRLISTMATVVHPV